MRISKGLLWFIDLVSFIEIKIEEALKSLGSAKEGILVPLIRRFWPSWLLPNYLTALRGLIGLGIIGWLIATDGVGYQNNNWFAALVIFTCLTDFLDGPVARVKDKESRFGSLFDKIVDKILILPLGTVEFWPLDRFLVVLSIGGTVVVLITAAYKYLQKTAEVPENIFGKCGMLGYSFCIILAIWPSWLVVADKIAWVSLTFGLVSIICNFRRHFGLTSTVRVEPVKFVTPAEKWIGVNVEMSTITVVKSESGLTVDGEPATMEYQEPQLRFIVGGVEFIVFNKFLDNSKPPKPIAEMYEALK